MSLLLRAFEMAALAEYGAYNDKGILSISVSFLIALIANIPNPAALFAILFLILMLLQYKVS